MLLPLPLRRRGVDGKECIKRSARPRESSAEGALFYRAVRAPSVLPELQSTNPPRAQVFVFVSPGFSAPSRARPAAPRHQWAPRAARPVPPRRLLLAKPAAPAPLPPYDARSPAPRPPAPPSLAPVSLAAAAVAIVEPRDAPTAAPSPPLPRTSPHHAHPILALTLASRRPRARRSKTTWAKGIAAASCVLGLKLRPL